MGKAPAGPAGVRPGCRACGERLLAAFAATRPDLLRALAHFLGSVEEAQDAAQETFLKCWRTRDHLAGVTNLRAWIFRVGLNTARDFNRNGWKRHARPLPPFPDLDGRPAPSPAEQLLHGEDLERLRVALRDLRSSERDVFLLRQNSDLTYDEIAALRRAPVGTVKTQMRTALHKLRAVLGEPGP